jgi:hypothetical protein
MGVNSGSSPSPKWTCINPTQNTTSATRYHTRRRLGALIRSESQSRSRSRFHPQPNPTLVRPPIPVVSPPVVSPPVTSLPGTNLTTQRTPLIPPRARAVADDTGALSSALGLVLDAQAIFGGPRLKRGAVVIENGEVKSVVVEPNPGEGESESETEFESAFESESESMAASVASLRCSLLHQWSCVWYTAPNCEVRGARCEVRGARVPPDVGIPSPTSDHTPFWMPRCVLDAMR